MLTRIKTFYGAFAQNFGMTRKVYLMLPLELLGLFVAGALVFGFPTFIFLGWFSAILIGVLGGLIAAVFWFSRRAMRAAYSQIEGQPGAAGAVAQSLRGGWVVTPGVAATKQQDLVTRIVGKPGVILIGEGSPSRVEHLLANERRKTARWLPDTPIYDMQVGLEPGQIKLNKLAKELNKLPRNLRGGEITAVRRRLEALGTAADQMPIPKGPMPTSARQVRRQR